MNEYLTTPQGTENIELQIEPSEERTEALGRSSPMLYIDPLKFKLIQDLQYGSYLPGSGSISRSTELEIYKKFIGTASIELRVYNKSDALYEQIQDEIFRFKRFISEEIKISENTLSKIAYTISKSNYTDIAFDLSSDLNLSARIMLNNDYLLIVNIPLSDPDFFQYNYVFFSLFHSKELLISFKKEFNELIEGISTLNS